ncbi:hypothetical protein, partial [Ligilactobacillus equi]|uniref:hypothetical protein n=1 Tax=Ligilactobacillus equi TaxID=137357 RepID=UPI001CDA5F5E
MRSIGALESFVFVTLRSTNDSDVAKLSLVEVDSLAPVCSVEELVEAVESGLIASVISPRSESVSPSYVLTIHSHLLRQIHLRLMIQTRLLKYSLTLK